MAAVTRSIATLVLNNSSCFGYRHVGDRYKLEWLSIILLLLGLAIVAFTTRLLHLPDVSDVFVFVLYSGILLVLLGIPGVLALVLQFVVSIIRPRFKNCLAMGTSFKLPPFSNYGPIMLLFQHRK